MFTHTFTPEKTNASLKGMSVVVVEGQSVTDLLFPFTISQLAERLNLMVTGLVLYPRGMYTKVFRDALCG